ncbi:glycosyltransferase family 4 protein [Sphingobacterium bovisgrunnientis]|uniref:glycosyltransferase family 4 protein n=1 Tax=Sphingobacterium bovisgrunnientis TaxID=1874697 RepID=UPI00135AB987|nr:glycosyltransferase family 4 protein [Sphingobacterium bovisgrunnientis]
MRVLLLYDYPPSPGGLSTQGDLLYKGLIAIGVDAHAVHWDSEQEKEWYYAWFKPDIVVGVGYWGHVPSIVVHPQRFGQRAVPWLVADGYIANYRDILNELPLILATSNWVKEMYIRDGISGDKIEVLPVGCPTDSFIPYASDEPKILAVRKQLGISEDEIMILTIGGDAASKGSNEVMQALALIDKDVPSWKYVCKVWPQPRTSLQNQFDQDLAKKLAISEKVIYATNTISRDFMPYLIGACDIYAAPSRLEGFGMPQVEAGACGKPVLGIRAMGMLDTLVHGETALLARVGKQIVVDSVILGPESGYEVNHLLKFDVPRTVDYRADIRDIADGLLALMQDSSLRSEMGAAGRKRVEEHFDYIVVARRFVKIIQEYFKMN